MLTLTLFGCPVASDDAAWLVTRLFRDAHAPAMSAGITIEKGLELGLYAVALDPAERHAILGVLDDPLPGLADLRGALARDHRNREGLRTET